jgi:hypothetical protein
MVLLSGENKILQKDNKIDNSKPPISNLIQRH